MTNVIIGYVLAIIIQIIIYPLYGITISIYDNISIATIFTVVSLVRCYIIRRLFNRG